MRAALRLALALATAAGAASSAGRDPRADARAKISLYTKTLASWGKADERAGGKALLLLHRGEAFAALGRRREALADYDAAVALLPDDAELRAARSGGLASFGRCAEAVDDARAAVRLSSGAAQAPFLLSLGAIERDCSRDYEAAAADFDRAFAASGDEAARRRVLVETGLDRCLEGRVLAGRDLLERARLADPKDALAAYGLAVCRQAEGRNDEALALLDEAVGSGTASWVSEARFRRGQLERAKGERLAAREDFKESCRLGFARACRTVP